MAITSASLSSTAGSRNRDRDSGLLGDFRVFWRQFFARTFDPYRPELHYMRGPGPAWHAKQMTSSHLRSIRS